MTDAELAAIRGRNELPLTVHFIDGEMFYETTALTPFLQDRAALLIEVDRLRAILAEIQRGTAILWDENTGLTPAVGSTYSYDAAEAYACKVCGARPDATGWLKHSKGCYCLDFDGGGGELVDVPWAPFSS